MSYQNPYTASREKRNEVYYEPGSPISIKADCKEGLFLPLGEDATIPDGKAFKPNPLAQKSVKMQVVKYGHLPNAILFPPVNETPKRATYTQVFFVDSRGVLSSMLLKGESRDNFLKQIREIEINGAGETRFVDFEFTASMEARKSEKFKSTYYAIEFSAQPLSKDVFERNQGFASVNYDDVFDSRVIQEYVVRNVPNYEAYEMPLVCAELLHAFGFIPESKVAQLTGASSSSVSLLTAKAAPQEAAQ